jgi:hypothetical protein
MDRKEYQKQYRDTHRKTANAYAKAYKARNRELVRARAKHRYDRVGKSMTLKHKYGITIETRNAMYVEQGGRCASCGDEIRLVRGEGKLANVDHDHATKKVRSILCSKCNVALGLLDDSPEKILALLTYITRWKER